MAKRTGGTGRRRGRAGSVSIDIDGLEEMVAGIKRGRAMLRDAMRDVLRGEVGATIMRETRARVSDYSRTGRTAAAVGRDDDPQGVRVGVLGGRVAQGTWLESGVRPHLIPTKPGKVVAFNGTVRSRVTHPGTRGRRIMRTVLRVVKSDAEQALVEGLERRLSVPMNLH